MKIFIGGSKMISDIDGTVKEKLSEIIKKQYNVLIGDCWGIDKSVQQFFNQNNYRRVTVYASGNKVRNNVGNFEIRNIQTDVAEGFEFYRQKDIAMAIDADCGFMIWDSKSKGTLNNIIDLVNQNKQVEIYFRESRTLKIINADTLSKNDVINPFEKIIYDAYKDVTDALK